MEKLDRLFFATFHKKEFLQQFYPFATARKKLTLLYKKILLSKNGIYHN
jgi:hypothetical protein